MLHEVTISNLWVFFSAILVIFMQVGFLCVESGLTRQKNSINVAFKNIFDFAICNVCFLVFGFGLIYGQSISGFIGNVGAVIPIDEMNTEQLVYFFLQMAFFSTSATIVSGAIAERTHLRSYGVITLLMCTLIYPVICHWSWNESGWLHRIGFVDFAGGTVVHSVGGWASLAILLIIGPRKGIFEKKLTGSNLPMFMMGILILGLGWIGFNGGSLLAFNEKTLHIVLKTIVAGSSGFLAIYLYTCFKGNVKVAIEDASNGFLAALVSITPACHVVSYSSSLIIGVLGGFVSFFAARALIKLRIDDAVGAIPVHLFGGMWGTIAVALFSEQSLIPSHLSRLDFLGIQMLGICATATWVFLVTYIILSVYNRFNPLRISSDDEDKGLNFTEHGASTELTDLLTAIDTQIIEGDFSTRVREEPFTVIGQIAKKYNKALGRIEALHNEKIESEKRVEHASRLASIGELSAGVAHEINNPLTIINVNSKIILNKIRKGSSDTLSPITELMEGIVEATARVAKIVNSIKKLSHKEICEEFIPTKLANVFDVAHPFIINKLNVSGVELLFDRDADFAQTHFLGDELTLSQVIVNLLSNAVDAIKEGESPWIKIDGRVFEDSIELSFTDSGHGIPLEVQDYIFVPFYTTKEVGTGTGLGLSLSHSIIQRHKGDISINNKSPNTQFVIRLPRSPKGELLKAS